MRAYVAGFCGGAAVGFAVSPLFRTCEPVNVFARTGWDTVASPDFEPYLETRFTVRGGWCHFRQKAAVLDALQHTSPHLHKDPHRTNELYTRPHDAVDAQTLVQVAKETCDNAHVKFSHVGLF